MSNKIGDIEFKTPPETNVSKPIPKKEVPINSGDQFEGLTPKHPSLIIPASDSVDLSRLNLKDPKDSELAIKLVQEGADPSKIDNSAMIQYPKLLTACLPKMPLVQKDKLLSLLNLDLPKNRESASLLIQAGANPNIWAQERPLGHLAVVYGDTNLLLSCLNSSLFRHDQTDSFGGTLIQFAIYNDEYKIYNNEYKKMEKLLLENEKQKALLIRSELLLAYRRRLEKIAQFFPVVETKTSQNPGADISTFEPLQARLGTHVTSKTELLNLADAAGLLDIPDQGAKPSSELDQTFLKQQADKLLDTLLKDYENYKTGLGLQGGISAANLEATRAIISERISLERSNLKKERIELQTQLKILSEPEERLKTAISLVELKDGLCSVKNTLSAINLKLRDELLSSYWREKYESKKVEKEKEKHELENRIRFLPPVGAKEEEEVNNQIKRRLELEKRIAELKDKEKLEEKKLNQKVDFYKTTASAAQFSGALQFAHQHGITGKDVQILVAEDVESKYLGAEIGSTAKAIGLLMTGNEEESQHGLHVTGIVQQMAPDAPIRVISPSYLFIPETAKIVNCSFGSSIPDITSLALKKAFSSGKLIIKGSGNDGKPLDYQRNDMQRIGDQNFLTDLEDSQKARMILTGNLQAGNVPGPSSNRPGDNLKLQDHFLWTLGSDVLSLIEPDKVDRKSGTSMSAPVVTGAAALVQSLCPKFTPEEVKECLVESADRDFWMHRTGVDIHVTEKPSVLQIKPGKTESDPVEATWPFEKSIFGKGLLNVRRALEYAYLKKEHKLGSEAIREILDYKEQKAASKIQNWFRREKKLGK